MANIYKYIDLCSQSRIRSQWPNPADFVAPISYGANSATTAFEARDPIVNGVPVENTPSLTQAGSTATSIVLNASSSSLSNYYVHDYLQVGTEFRLITSYNATTQAATVSAAFSAAPVSGTVYYLRKALPVLSSTLSLAPSPLSNQNVLNLGTAASPIDSVYVGTFIYFTSGPNIGVSMLIVQYVGSSNMVLLSKALPYYPGTGDAYDILNYTRDNFSPLIYSGTIGSGSVCYSMELIYLTIPNQLIKSGYGGTLDKYPYLYLYIYNEGNPQSDHVLYTNNSYAQSALFKVPLGLNLKTETFFTLKDAKMIQVCKFKPDQPVHFRLTLPNGEPIIFDTPDNMSPLAPNDFLQISATLAIKRMDSGDK